MAITVQPWAVYFGLILFGIFTGIGNQLGQYIVKHYIIKKYNKIRTIIYNKHKKIKKVLL
jgi:hypothetical protein